MQQKIIQVLYSGFGGHGSVAFSLGGAARKNGSWNNIFLFVGIEPLLPEYERICQEGSVPYHYVRTTQGRVWRSWPQIFKALKKDRPDAIILHSVKTILPCWLYARLHKIPLLAVEHQANALKKRSEWIVSKLLIRLAHKVIVLTSDYRHELMDALGATFRADKVQIIPNGIDVSAFSPRQQVQVVKQGKVVVGMAARFSSLKRQAALIDALSILRSNHSQYDWRLTLAGDGETLDSVREMIVQAGLQEVVDLPGYLGQEDLVEWFGTLDIYAHASDGETLSTSLLQAMAMGLPIVASDVPGISNLLGGEPVCGLLIEDSASEGFAAVIATLTDNPSMASQLSITARELAVTTYSQDAMFSGYASLLSDTCQKSST